MTWKMQQGNRCFQRLVLLVILFVNVQHYLLWHWIFSRPVEISLLICVAMPLIQHDAHTTHRLACRTDDLPAHKLSRLQGKVHRFGLGAHVNVSMLRRVIVAFNCQHVFTQVHVFENISSLFVRPRRRVTVDLLDGAIRQLG